MGAYRTKPDVRLMTLGVQYYVTAKAFDAAQRRIDLLSPEVRGQYERDNLFDGGGLAASGLRNHGEALRLYRLALQRSPADATVMEAVLWTPDRTAEFSDHLRGRSVHGRRSEHGRTVLSGGLQPSLLR